MPPILFNYRYWFLHALLILGLGLVGCSTSDPQSTFDASGPVARTQLDLFWLILWGALAIFVLVGGILVYSVIRFREKNQQELPVQTEGNRFLEFAWTLIPALMLIVLSVITVRTIFELDSPPSDNPLRVEVVAHQWWFEAIYPDYGVTTANDIVVPVGMDVDITLISPDVIHSFWVPKLAGKQDVVPNHPNKMWFRADKVGTFYGQCAEFCGIAHALMKFTVVVKDEKGFQDWMIGQQRGPVVATGQAAVGAQVFAAKGCLACHSTNGADSTTIRDSRDMLFRQGQAITHGPNLTHFASRDTFAGAIENITEENLTSWLVDPESFKPGNRMARLAPAFNDSSLALGDEDIAALVAYLMSLK